MSFVSEIKRRKIFQVAAVYGIVAWLLVQIVATIEEPLNLPDWADTFIIVLLGIGFPITLIMSWAFNVTSDGLVRDTGGRDGPQGTSRGIEYALIGLLCLAVAFLFVDNYVLNDRSKPPAATAGQTAAPPTIGTDAAPSESAPAQGRSVLPNSVAVLPFENLSPNPDDAYYAAGLHEEVLNQLAKLRNLSVISRTSVQRYEDTQLSIPEIAAELNVGTVMEGSVRFAGNQIRVTTQLIDAATDEHLWSETYQRSFDDIFAIESEIAMNVANALQAAFSLAEQRSIEKVPTASSEAYTLYLQATLASGRSNDAAHALLDEALRLDPNFAAAYATKAARYAASMVNTVGSSAEGDWLELARLAKENAERAIAIDPGIGLAYQSLGAANMWLWRWDQADETYARAVELSPNDTNVLWPAAWFRAFSGSSEDAIRIAEREIELAPLVSKSYLDLGVAQEHAGNIEAAIDAHRNAITLDPSNLLSRQHLGLLAARSGNPDAAAMEFEFIERFFSNGEIQPVFLPELAIGYTLIGRDDDARRIADQIFALAEQRDMGAGSLAMAYLAIGDIDNAIAQLERAAERAREQAPDQGFFSLMLIKHNVLGYPLLDEPRFRTLRAQLGNASI